MGKGDVVRLCGWSTLVQAEMGRQRRRRWNVAGYAAGRIRSESAGTL